MVHFDCNQHTLTVLYGCSGLLVCMIQTHLKFSVIRVYQTHYLIKMKIFIKILSKSSRYVDLESTLQLNKPDYVRKG